VAIARGNAKAFGRWLKRQQKRNIPRWSVGVHKEIHVKISDGWIEACPVGNPARWTTPPPPGYTGGRARGNFQSSINVPRPGETGRVDKSGTATKLAGQQGIAGLESGGRSFITNNVPYIVGSNSLNDGHSPQAPAQFLENVVDKVFEQFKTGRI
jgi:hypothetical protein